jgi:hypothetical protein
MAFPFYKSIDSFIVNELNKRTPDNNVQLSKLVPWIRATSNLGGQYTLGTDTYSTLFDGTATDAYRNIPGSQWKFRPNPIITEFAVDFASRGTLRRCTLNIKCFSPDQLTQVQEYFLEPGISCFIQWGWNYSLASNKTIGWLPANVDNVNKYNRNAEALIDIRSANNGCYDNFVGIITGGQSSISGDEFTIQVKLASMGEILFSKTSESVTKKEENVVPITYDKKKMMEYGYSKSNKINFAYFFNQLPEELRTRDIMGMVDKFKNESDFINFNESLMEEAKSETTEGWWNGHLSFKGAKFEAADSESPMNGSKFLSFDSFVKLLNQTRVKFTKQGAVDFNIDITDTYCSSFPGIFSTDESLYIPNSECYNYLKDMPYMLVSGVQTGDTIDCSINGRSFPKKTSTTIKTEDGNVTFNPNTHGWIGDVYISDTVAFEALRNQTEPVKDILDGVLKKMSDAVVDLWEFQIREEKDGKGGVKMVIVDSNLRNNRSGKEGAQVQVFDMYGPKSCFLDASFDLDIPKAMASKVFMEKSTEGVEAHDELTKGLFSDKKDTILTKLTQDVSDKNSKPEGEGTTIEAKDLWTDFRRNVRFLMNPTKLQISDIGDGNMDEWALIGQYLNKRKFNEIKGKQLYTSNTEVYVGRTLPVGFTFTVLGMSGFQVGHLFRVNGLPKQYSTDRGAFQVEEIKHKIDGKLWTTEVSAHYRPFYK